MGHRPTPKGSGRRRWLNTPLDGRGQASGPRLLSEPPGRCLLPCKGTFHIGGRETGRGSGSALESVPREGEQSFCMLSRSMPTAFWCQKDLRELVNFNLFLKPRETERSACGPSAYTKLNLESSDLGLLVLCFKTQLPGGVPRLGSWHSFEYGLKRAESGVGPWLHVLELRVGCGRWRRLVLVALPPWGVFLPGDAGQVGRC